MLVKVNKLCSFTLEAALIAKHYLFCMDVDMATNYLPHHGTTTVENKIIFVQIGTGILAKRMTCFRQWWCGIWLAFIGTLVYFRFNYLKGAIHVDKKHWHRFDLFLDGLFTIQQKYSRPEARKTFCSCHVHIYKLQYTKDKIEESKDVLSKSKLMSGHYW